MNDNSNSIPEIPVDTFLGFSFEDLKEIELLMHSIRVAFHSIIQPPEGMGELFERNGPLGFGSPIDFRFVLIASHIFTVEDTKEILRFMNLVMKLHQAMKSQSEVSGGSVG